MRCSLCVILGIVYLSLIHSFFCIRVYLLFIILTQNILHPYPCPFFTLLKYSENTKHNHKEHIHKTQMTAATTDHKNSLFKKMNLRKSMRNNKKATVVSSSSSDTTTKTTANPVVEPELVSRRVIKATAPPPTAADVVNPASTSSDQEEEKVEVNGVGIKGGADIAISLRSVQDETLREKTEQWRQERLDASAAIRKEKKEKEVKSHRESIGNTCIGTSKSSENLNGTNTTTKVEVPAVLTVASEFPEHKRKIRTTKRRGDDHDSGKKSRVDDGSGTTTPSSSLKETVGPAPAAAAEATDNEEEGKDWKVTTVDAIKRSVTPAAIVAVVAIVAMSLFRSKR